MLHGVGIIRLSTLSSECSYLLPSVHMTSSVLSVMLHGVSIVRLSTLSSECSYLLPSVHTTSSVLSVMLHGVGIVRLSTLSSECSYLLPSVPMTSSVLSCQRVIIHSVTSHKGYNWHSVRYKVFVLILSVVQVCILFHCIEENLKTQRFPH